MLFCGQSLHLKKKQKKTLHTAFFLWYNNRKVFKRGTKNFQKTLFFCYFFSFQIITHRSIDKNQLSVWIIFDKIRVYLLLATQIFHLWAK
jgi:hypothetical protein